ncbi:hypothetical protein Cch01nite_01200 [Cellulomonas chitinilytica]|uniref:Lipoprotein n=1 Tax=Cellulomonas chitinilytica TaxID=398759 RepID=A0A919P0F2_9CELL|nr:hypothetical protein [Cellulomonas chitinilytica]GIG19396.1 hypothetical protein Cch01nite_01200 [Cellulomonas chitinilytica]
MSGMNRSGVLTGAVLVAVLLAGCTGKDDPSPTSAPSGSSSAAKNTSMTREELQKAVFGADLGTSTVLGSVDGAVPDPAHPLPARIDVTSVVADDSSTVVKFTLVNTAGTDPLVQMSAFNKWRPLAGDIRDVALVDPDAGLRLRPFVGWLGDTSHDAGICTCATAPLQMSEVGQLLSATFPALDAATTTVSVEIPGFPAVEGVPVTRR